MNLFKSVQTHRQLATFRRRKFVCFSRLFVATYGRLVSEMGSCSLRLRLFLVCFIPDLLACYFILFVSLMCLYFTRFKGDLPEERHMKVDNKNFYFDIGQNNRGVYMRISEVKSNFRTAITVPEKCWLRFRDIFNDYCDKMKKSSDTSSITADNNIQTPANSLK
ncbi:unnamed protein product [Ceratitis capitata]|uniref:(Mediterranean fruit fly) hypothetical protein n=1 Tax=Ceratitis capitata TaxID=7213 RepID=A0A811UQC8_CERCA|nr:unnamed protein product [Ceratitis capitata]